MGNNAFVINPFVKNISVNLSQYQSKLDEAKELTKAIDLVVVYSESYSLKSIRPSTYLGKGVVENLKQHIDTIETNKKPDVIIVNAPLSPIQQRNLEKAWKSKVIDRTGLILEIFGARAQTKEGKLQVELASLEYQKSRLVRSWTHLERQRGGAGFMGGPGETQIELDRRIIQERITQIKKELEKVKNNRDLQKRHREKIPYPIIAIVGYTNVGKSTLFNKLTKSKILAKDMLFATLDTTMRRLSLPSGREGILSDTVGFISDLPTHLIAAFRGTLEQLEYADLILHVQDLSSPKQLEQKQDVENILKDFGIEPEDPRILNVYNKIDALEEEDKEDYLKFVKPNEVYISAISNEGINELIIKIDKLVLSHAEERKLTVPYNEGKMLSWLYENSEIIDESHEEKGIVITALTASAKWGKFDQLFDQKEERSDRR